jgi:S-adenosylmethionine/arginine decarboxylase-like enzyme
MTTPGYHVVADLFGCDLAQFCPNEASVTTLLEDLCQIIRSLGMTPVGEPPYSSKWFGPAAVTATILLAESHVSFHTWPEHNSVQLDIFVCNESRDNSPLAESLLEELATTVFSAANVDKQVLYRNLTRVN